MELNGEPMLKTVKLQTELCIIGGGVAGLCAALAAARHGRQVVLMHDRPVPGGNASSEIRMWIRGAYGKDCRETGIVEELLLENLYRNPKGNMSIWDGILYGKLQYAPGLTLLLNTSCLAAETAGNRIVRVRGWQGVSQTYYEVEAELFADCSGDSILAALTPARYRFGRESSAEFGESVEPAVADRQTMGSSCLIQIREADREVPFRAPEWAEKYRDSGDLPAYRDYQLSTEQNFWYIEIGGSGNVIDEVDLHRERLLRIAFGLWDYLKNFAADRDIWRNWELDWVGFLPGKRESRRYVGDYLLTQHDVAGGGKFADVIAYGGWTMDDHHPDGFDYPGPPTIHHPVPTPFGIPYRSLYSVNIDNLLFAGRNISVTHAALSAARVMATCATIGQAAGTAAALAIEKHLTPREVGGCINELQQRLLDDDCYLPGVRRRISVLTRTGTLVASNGNDPEPLRDGIDRPIGDQSHSWAGAVGDTLTYCWREPVALHEIRMVFDSDLNRLDRSTVPVRFRDEPDNEVPATLVTGYRLDYQDENGDWRGLFLENDNYQRLGRVPAGVMARSLRLTILGGKSPVLRLFSFEVNALACNRVMGGNTL